MELRPEFQIKTVIKALTEIVLPAVDADNQLAQEQGKLAVAVLQMALQNLPLMFRYDRVELSELIALADQLWKIAEDQGPALQPGKRLQADMKNGREILGQAGIGPSEMHGAIFALRETIGAFVTEGYGELDDALVAKLGRAVTAHAQTQLLRERALLIDQGWEATPDQIPAIETLIEDKQDEVCKT